MISIGDPGEAPPRGLRVPRRVLRLEFRDTTDVSDPLAPREEDVASILAFAPTVEELGGICLVHCQAGLSRSPAAAILLLASMCGPQAESTAVHQVRRLAPNAFPNMLLIALGDSLLSRNGSLRQAVETSFASAAAT